MCAALPLTAGFFESGSLKSESATRFLVCAATLPEVEALAEAFSMAVSMLYHTNHIIVLNSDCIRSQHYLGLMLDIV